MMVEIVCISCKTVLGSLKCCGAGPESVGAGTLLPDIWCLEFCVVSLVVAEQFISERAIELCTTRLRCHCV